MSASPDQDEATPTPPDKSTVILMLSDIADVTWRMFVPAIGLTLLGLYIDSLLGSTPWLLLTGIVIGATLSYVLVRRQIKRINQMKD